MLAADAPWWMGEWGHLPHNANDNRPNGTGANADNFPQPPNTTENTYRGANFSPSNRPSPDYTGRLPEPFYGPRGQPNPPAPQTPPGGWMYNKTNPAPSFSPVLPTPKPAPPRPGQAQSAPPPASQYAGPDRRLGGPGGTVGNITPLPGYRDEPRGVPSAPSFGPNNPRVKNYTPAPTTGYDKPGALGDITQYEPRDLHNKIDAWTETMPKNERGDPYGTRYLADVGTSRPTSRTPAASPRPPAPSMRTADRYTRPEGYVPNSTLWAQHAPTPEPEPAPYNPNPPKAPKPNVFPEMQRGPSASYLASPGYSTQATWDQSKGKMGQASYSGAMTMNANMANPGGESMRPQGFTFTAKGVDGKQYANPADAMARRDALINNLGQQQARYSGSMGRNLGAPQFNMKQAMGQGAR